MLNGYSGDSLKEYADENKNGNRGEFDEVQQDTAVVEDAHDDGDHVDEGDLTHSSSVEADERSNKEN